MNRHLLAAALLLVFSACGDSTAPPPTITSVAFDTDAVTLLTDDSVSTHVTVTNSLGETVTNPDVTFNTSAGYIASVDATGKVRAVAPGAATITASVGSVTDQLHVTVNWPPVESVDLQIPSADLFVDDTVPTTIAVINSKAKPATNAAVTYSTSAPTVATVDAIGRVTGVGSGTATITATAEGISDVVEVTVAWAPIVSLAFSRDTATLLLDDSLVAPVVVLNSRGRVARNAVITYAWSTDGVATIDAAGKIRTVAMGSATLTATAEGLQDDIGLTVVPHFTMMALGGIHACGVSGVGGLWCWGSDDAGQLGQPRPVTCVAAGQCSMVPLRVPGDQRFVSASLGAWHSCALTDAGAAYCWGSNAFGQLGSGSTTTGLVRTPTAVAGGLTFASLHAGRWHMCGITTAGDTYCWGYDNWGQLGTGDPPTERCNAFGGQTLVPCSRVPVKVVGDHDFIEIEGREKSTCGRTEAGAIYCWGLEVGGTESTECQNDLPSDRCTRTPLIQAGGATYAGLLSTGGMTCGRTAAGALDCWGSAFYGEFGNGVEHTNTATPIAAAGGATFAQTVTGSVHLCSREADNSVKCWGNGNYGTGSQGPDIPSRVTPTALGGGIAFSQLFGSAGTGTTCGLSVAGRAYCWGDGRFGQLGNNAAVIHLEPVLVRLAH
ncbi:MAG: Ig-like domain-containing protein [Gemmatimonadaceae bacterium]